MRYTIAMPTLLLSTQVNGVDVTSPAFNVSTKDRVRVDGKELSTHLKPAKLWAVYKPKRELVARSDPGNRPCLLDRISAVGLPDTLMPIGRLDFMTEGLVSPLHLRTVIESVTHESVTCQRCYR
jgi:16S rRNA U516 pseudouridylate synthase RsuA-like enzyme